LKKEKLTISVSNINDAVATFLVATNVIPSHEYIADIDIPLKAKKGLVTVELTTKTERN
jgi:hypothetical protein